MSEICAALHEWAREKERIGFPFQGDSIPSNGIYLLFEKKENGHGGDRIVRVGTHRGDSNLLLRLREHFLVENKDRSIFRKNIGRSLLVKDCDPFLAQWEKDLTSRKGKAANAGKVNVKKKEETEQRVTRYIRSYFSFVIIPTRRGSKERLALEDRLISTISLCEECEPSKGWLGSHSPVDKICESGMWNVQSLWKTPIDSADLRAIMASGS
jgi:hypothetical protein